MIETSQESRTNMLPTFDKIEEVRSNNYIRSVRGYPQDDAAHGGLMMTACVVAGACMHLQNLE
jgi:hypothetical protein